MSITVQSLVWDTAPYDGNTFLTLLALADYSNPEGYCFPNMDTLAKKARQSVRSAQYAVAALRRDGFLEVAVNPGKGRKNDFKINLQKLHRLAEQKVQMATVKGANYSSKRCKLSQRNKEEPSLEPSIIQKHHDFVALIESEPYQNAQAVRDWMVIKEHLRTLVPSAEWAHWVRPLYLFNVLTGMNLLVACPPDGRIVKSAKAGLTQLRCLARKMGYQSLHLTPYPDDYDLERLNREASPAFWAGIPPALRKRVGSVRRAI